MAFISGFSLALSLILGIGAQNIFVLKQAIKRNYAISTAVICFCDVILIFFSVVLTTTMVRYLAVVRPIMLIFAVLFLVYYGIFSIKSSFTRK